MLLVPGAARDHYSVAAERVAAGVALVFEPAEQAFAQQTLHEGKVAFLVRVHSERCGQASPLARSVRLVGAENGSKMPMTLMCWNTRLSRRRSAMASQGHTTSR